jgi:hypothetical protein
MSPLRFSRLACGDRPVRGASLFSEWMQLSAGDSLAPSPVPGHAFTLSPTRLSDAARRYLRLVDPLDQAERDLRNRSSRRLRSLLPINASIRLNTVHH